MTIGRGSLSAGQYRAGRAARQMAVPGGPGGDAGGRRRHRWALVFVLLGAALAVTWVAGRVLGRDLGLSARYYSGPAARRVLVFETRDPGITKDLVRRRSSRVPGDPLLVEWSGFLSVVAPVDRAFALGATGRAELAIDGKVVAVVGQRGVEPPSGPVALRAGSHAVAVRYEADERPPAIDLWWAEPGRALAAVPRTALSVVPMSPAQARATALQPVLLAVLAAAWQLALAAFLAWRLVGLARRSLVETWAEWRRDRFARRIVGAGAVLCACGLWWGLPSQRGWAPDEIVPEYVLAGLRAWYAGGWHEIYPAFSFMVPGLLSFPVLAVDRLTGAPADGLATSTALFVIVRAWSVLAAGGVVWFVQATARELAGRTAGLIAGFVAAAMPALVYYGKTGNVEAPYLFWFAVSVLCFVRAARHEDPAALKLFAIAGTLALCTKDQAYAFYVLPGLVLSIPRLRRWFNEPSAAARRAAVRGRDLAAAAGLAVATFAVGHNLPFDTEGFVAHVAFITGDASAPYRVWSPGPSGQVAMAVEAARQITWLLGLPAALVLAAALAGEAARARRRLALLVVPVLSYYLFFCEVAGYLYDRFLMGPALVAAVVVGMGAARVIEGPGARLRRASAVALWVTGVYLLARAASVDLLMITDSRYAVERWLEAHAAAPVVVAGVGPLEVLPRYERQPYVSLRADPGALVRASPDLVVLNAGFLDRFGPGTPEHEFYRRLAGGASGYTMAFASGREWRWLPLAWERPFRDPSAAVSNLAQISPRVEVYRRR